MTYELNRLFVATGGRRGFVEFLRYKQGTDHVDICDFNWHDFIIDACNDRKIALLIGELLSGEATRDDAINAIAAYAYNSYQQEVDQFRGE